MADLKKFCWRLG